MSIRILVNGAHGKMGQEVCRAIKEAPGLMLVAGTDREDDLSEAIHVHQAQVVVDFTLPNTVYENAVQIIDAGAHPVIGTSGLSIEQVQQLQQRCAEKKRGGLIAPNFAIGVALMNKYAQDCARYFPDVEIIECHHAAKVDAPSGTAVQTAQLISAVRSNAPGNPHEKESLAGVRGGRYNGIPIHSVRVPGLLAQQMVLFGGQGQTLTLRHDALSRETYMPGVCLACHKVMELDHLVYGLEQIL